MKKAIGYQRNLAFIHDMGYSSFSLEAAAELIDLFRKHPLPDKRIVELGCGSGRLAHVLLTKGFSVTGIGSSSAMILLARKNAPKGRFSPSSIWDYHFPQAGAVISIGEVLNRMRTEPLHAVARNLNSCFRGREMEHSEHAPVVFHGP